MEVRVRTGLPRGTIITALAVASLLAAARVPAATPEPPEVHWRQVLRRYSPVISNGPQQTRVYLDEIPLRDWLDPELHRRLRKVVTRWTGWDLDAARMSERLEWAFAQRPELARIWLPPDSIQTSSDVLTFFHKHHLNPFETAPEAQAHYRELARQHRSDADRAKTLLQWLAESDGAIKVIHPSPLNAPGSADWEELDRLYSRDPAFRRTLDATVLTRLRNAPARRRKTQNYAWETEVALSRMPSLAAQLLETHPQETLKHVTRPALGKTLAHRPGLRQKLFEAAGSNALFGTDLWLEFPETQVRLRQLAMALGLDAFLKQASGTFLGSPLFEAWALELPEDWMVSELGKLRTVFSPDSRQVDRFLVPYGRRHAAAREAMLQGDYARLEDQFSRTPGPGPKGETAVATYLNRDHTFELPPLKAVEEAKRTHDEREAKTAASAAAKNPKPARTPKAFTLDEEHAGRLALEADTQRYRGFAEGRISAKALQDARYAKAVEKGEQVRKGFLAQGEEALAKQGFASNPFPALHKSLERFLRNQDVPVPGIRPLKAHEIDIHVRQALQDWPEDPRDPEDQLMRREHERELRRRLDFREVPSQERARAEGSSPQIRVRAFRAWRRAALRRLESDYRRNLKHFLEQLHPHGFVVYAVSDYAWGKGTRTALTPRALNELRLNANGDFVDGSGVAVKLALNATETSLGERALLAGPTRLTSEQLAERFALLRSWEELKESHGLAIRSLGRETVRPEALLNYYDWNRAHRLSPPPADEGIRLNAYLWSRVSSENPNAWRDLQQRAISENRRTASLKKLALRVAKAMSGASLVAALLGTGINEYQDSSRATGGAKPGRDPSAAEAKRASNRVNRPSLENPGPPPEGDADLSLYGLVHSSDARPRYYSLGYTEEFLRPGVETLQTEGRLVVTDLGPDPYDHPSLVRVFHRDGEAPDEHGLILLARPEAGVLSELDVNFYRADGRPFDLAPGTDYVILRDPRTHDLALRILKPDPQVSYTLDYGYRVAPPGTFEAQEAMNLHEARAFDPVLEESGLRPILRQLREAGFEGLPEAVEARLRKNGGRITGSEIKKLMLGSNAYSYRPTGAPKRATAAQWEMNRFLAYSVALNEIGEYAAVCGAQNLLEAEILRAYFGPEGPYRTEVRSSFANSDGDNALKISEMHARTYVFRAGEPGVPIVLDATPSRTDGPGGTKRTDPLPGHGSTPEERRHRHELTLTSGVLGKKREDDELDRFFRELERLRLAHQDSPLTAQEHLVRKMLLAQDAAALAGKPVALRDPASLFARAEPAYRAVAAIEASKRENLKIGKTVRTRGRRKGYSGLGPSFIVRHANRLTTEALRLFSEGPGKEAWEARSREIRNEAARLRQRIEDLRTGQEINDRLSVRGRKPALSPEQKAARKRLGGSRRRPPSLPEDLRATGLAELIETHLSLVETSLGRLEPETLEALSGMRSLLPDEHRARIEGAVLSATGADGGSCLTGSLFHLRRSR